MHKYFSTCTSSNCAELLIWTLQKNICFPFGATFFCSRNRKSVAFNRSVCLKSITDVAGQSSRIAPTIVVPPGDKVVDQNKDLVEFECVVNARYVYTLKFTGDFKMSSLTRKGS